MTALRETLRSYLAADFGSHCVGHALDHLDRVHCLAVQIADEEGGDPAVLAAASYLHDYHRVVEQEGLDDDNVTEERIRRALAAITFPDDRIEVVLACIAFTDRYSFAGHVLKAPCVEAAIVRDADNLDALGAIGIARAFMFGGRLGEPLWAEGVTPETTYRSGMSSSVLHHFFEKLLRVRDDMLTATGRQLADDRHDYMLTFLGRLQAEWDAPGLKAELLKHQSVTGRRGALA
ncbi:MAG: HD domain-containing protein [Conexibacter sp.]